MKTIRFITSIGFLTFLYNEVNGHLNCRKQASKDFHEENVLTTLASVLRQWHWNNVLLISNMKGIKAFTLRLSSNMVQSSVVLLRANRSITSSFMSFVQVSPPRFIVWCDMINLEQVFVTAKKNFLLTSRVSWLILIDKIQLDVLHLRLQNFMHYLREDSNIYVLAWGKMQSPKYNLFHFMFQRFPSGYITYHLIASLNSSNELLFMRSVSMQQRLNDYDLTIAVIHYPPAMILDESVGYLRATGYLPDVIAVLANVLGFRYTFVRPKVNSFGILSDNSSSDGVLGLLQMRNADVGAFGLDLRRLSAVDYAGYMLTTYPATAYRNPYYTRKVEFTSYLKPFSASVWILIMIAWILSSLLLRQVDNNNSHPSKTRWEGMHCHKKHSTPFKILLYGFQFIEEFVAVGFRPLIELLCCRTSTRIVMLTVFGFVLLINYSYTSVLISTNTVVKKNWDFQDIGDLVQFGYKAGVLRGSYFEEDIKEDKCEKIRKAWHKIQSDRENLVASTLIGVQRVCKEHFAFFDSALALHAVDGRFCDYEIVRSQRGLNFNLAVPETSSYKEIFSSAMIKLKSAGVLDHLEWKHGLKDALGKSKSRPKIRKPTFKFVEAVAAFIFLAAGFVLAVIVLLIEICMYRQFLLGHKVILMKVNKKSVPTENPELIIKQSRLFESMNDIM